MVLHSDWAQVEVIELINDGAGLAFGIIGGRSTGVVVKTILPGGVADRDGRLQSGDHILQIGDVNLRGLGSDQAASVLRQCGVHVKMVVARPLDHNVEKCSYVRRFAVVPTKVLGDPVELARHLVALGYAQVSMPTTEPYIYADHHAGMVVQGNLTNVRNNQFSAPFLTGAVIHDNAVEILHETDVPETEKHVLELKKDDLGLGITVAGYVCEKEDISGIFVKSISKGSAADSITDIKVNDRILEVNGISVLGITNHAAVEILRQAGPVVKLTVERYLRGPKFERLQEAIRANELRPASPLTSTLTSLPKVPLSEAQMEFLNIEPDDPSCTSFEFDSTVLLNDYDTPVNEEKEIVIGSERKTVHFSIQNEDVVYDKWKDRIDVEAEIVIAQMYKSDNSGLGISLEGTVDVENGIEVRPHHYIRNVLPDGPVGRNGILHSGDELLEVNGVQLMGLNHLEVVSILKQLPSNVCLVCARYSVPIGVIDTSQRRDAFQTRKILAGSLQALLPSIEEANGKLVKAKSEASLTSLNSAEDTTERSKSLESATGLPLWSDAMVVIELEKGERGLGFSVLDYQDPLDPFSTVMIIRSVMPGGVADKDGRLLPGDRLLKVNDVDVSRAPLDEAVGVLKRAPPGLVRLGISKPMSKQIADGKETSEGSEDTEEQLTCLEDFEECIDECLDTLHICVDEDKPFNTSPCTSAFEDSRKQESFLC